MGVVCQNSSDSESGPDIGVKSTLSVASLVGIPLHVAEWRAIRSETSGKTSRSQTVPWASEFRGTPSAVSLLRMTARHQNPAIIPSRDTTDRRKKNMAAAKIGVVLGPKACNVTS
jgi:hypothetical protein